MPRLWSELRAWIWSVRIQNLSQKIFEQTPEIAAAMLELVFAVSEPSADKACKHIAVKRVDKNLFSKDRSLWIS